MADIQLSKFPYKVNNIEWNGKTIEQYLNYPNGSAPSSTDEVLLVDPATGEGWVYGQNEKLIETGDVAGFKISGGALQASVTPLAPAAVNSNRVTDVSSSGPGAGANANGYTGPPALSTPDPGHPGHFLYGGQGGGNQQNGEFEESVYNSNGKLLGTDTTIYSDGKKYIYGVDYGGTQAPAGVYQGSDGHMIIPGITNTQGNQGGSGVHNDFLAAEPAEPAGAAVPVSPAVPAAIPASSQPAAFSVPHGVMEADAKTETSAMPVSAGQVGAVAAGTVSPSYISASPQTSYATPAEVAQASAVQSEIQNKVSDSMSATPAAPAAAQSNQAPAAPTVKAIPVALTPAELSSGMDQGDAPQHGGGSAASGLTVKPKMTLPSASPHDLPLGGGLAGLDPSSGTHHYLGRH